MICRECAELVTEYLDDALPAPERAALEEHLEICAWCVDYVESISITVRTLHVLPAEPPDPQAKTHLLALFRAHHGG